MNFVFLVAIVLSITLLFLILLFFFQEKLIFKNGKKIDKNYVFKFDKRYKEVFIPTDGNNKINAIQYFVEKSKSKGIVLFCHGNKWNLITWGKRVVYFLKYDYDVLVFDYRNYGKSTGVFNEKKMYADASAVYNFIRQSYNEDKIVVYGFSLGSTFATRLAALYNPKELILEAPFYNFKKAVRYYNKWAPLFLLKYRFNTDKDIVKVKAPITIFHGDADTTTSFKESLALIKLSSLKKNRYVLLKKGTHHNLTEYKEYKECLQEILIR